MTISEQRYDVIKYIHTFAVTIPVTLETACPARGLKYAMPWMSVIEVDEAADKTDVKNRRE